MCVCLCSLFANSESPANKSTSEDDDTELQQPKKQNVERSTSLTIASCKANTVDDLAAEVVANVLRVSTSVVCSGSEDAMQNGTLVNYDDIATTKSLNINPLSNK